eukprot:gene7505-8096_t
MLMLPQVILQIIKDFLIINHLSEYDIDQLKSDGEFDFINWLEGQYAWRNFLSCCKGENNYWRNIIRKEMIDIRLNHYYSQRYLFDSNFRTRVLSSIRDPYQQLGVDLAHSFIHTLTEEDGKILSNLRYLNLSNNSELSIPTISHVYEVCIEGSSLTEIQTLHDIKILNLSGSTHLEEIRNLDDHLVELRLGECEVLTVIDPLPRRLKKLTYHRREAFDGLFSLLQELEELIILTPKPFRFGGKLNQLIPWHLPNLKKLEVEDVVLDLPSLHSNVPKLESLIWRKPSPSSSLQGHTREVIEEHVKHFFEANLLSKLKVFDVELATKQGMISKDQKNLTFMNYPQLNELTIDGVANPQGLEGLQHLRKITILDSSSFDDVSIFRHCNAVLLNDCNALTDVSSLGSVREVVLVECPNLTSVSGLGERNRRVDIVQCPQIHDVSMLGRVRFLTVDFCPNVIDISSLIHVPYLSVRGCINIKDFTGLGKHQKYLNLTGCRHLTNDNLYALAEVNSLIISYCENISDVSMLRNDRLIARNCQHLVNAHLYGNFLQVDFSRCRELRRLLVHGHVYALCLTETMIADEMSSMFVYGSVKYLTSEFEYPNQFESEYIQEEDEGNLFEDENEESDDEEEDDEDEDQWQDMGSDEEDDYGSGNDEEEEEQWEDIEEE